MKRMLPLALILSVLAGPSMAFSLSFDLPTLTWPNEGAQPEAAAVLATKGR